MTTYILMSDLLVARAKAPTHKFGKLMHHLMLNRLFIEPSSRGNTKIGVVEFGQ